MQPLSLSYDSIGEGLTFRVSIDNLSNRDKVSLFYKLMDDLGVTRAFHCQKDEIGNARKIIDNCTAKAWESKS